MESIRQTPDTFNLHMSLLMDIPENDFEITWKVNDATTQMDEFSRNFPVEKPLDTWVTGFCYFDYGYHGKEISQDQIHNGIRKLYIGVTRVYEFIRSEDRVGK